MDDYQKLKIMLIPAQLLPIPAVNGGGVELLITNMIDVNEIEKKVSFVIPSIYNEDAAKRKYQYTKIYYFKDGKCLDKSIKNKWIINYIILYLFTFIKKLFFNRFTYPLFKRNKIPYPDFFIHQCISITKKEHIDYIVNESCFIPAKSFSRLVKYIGEKRVYYRVHNMVPVGSLEEREVFKNSITLSEYGRSKWVSGCSVEGDNQVVYHGIDLKQFDERIGDQELDSLRLELGIKKEQKVIFFCGRIVPIKGVKELIEAFQKVEDQDAVLLIAGNASLEKNRDYFDLVLNQINKDERIKYLGFVPNNQLHKYYKIIDIQVIPSLCEEAAGLVAIEGMANGIPLIITESGGMVEYVDKQCAITIPRDSDIVKNLAKAIKELLADNQKRIAMSHHGKQRSKKYSKERNYYQFIKVFRK